MPPSCPLCHQNHSQPYFEDRRKYWQCNECQLVFVDSKYYLSAAEEKAEYDLHQNAANDQGYRQFLNRLFIPIDQKLRGEGNGLDFGSGPGPTLSLMFEEAGYTMAIYDIFYANDKTVLTQNYDFICCSEVVEHLSEPGRIIVQLWKQLKPGGILGIMTKRVKSLQAFTHWHYKNDLTHICFFSENSFEWLAQQLNASLEVVSNDVVLLIKND